MKLQLTWTIQEIGDVVHKEERACTAWLLELGVPIHGGGRGRTRFVFLSDLAAAIPAIEKSLALVQKKA